MTVYDAQLYRDPALVLEANQDSSGKRKAKCGRCIHYQTLVIAFEVHHGCTMKRRNWQACTYFETKGDSK